MTEKTGLDNDSFPTQQKPSVAPRDRRFLVPRQNIWLCWSFCGSIVMHLQVSYILSMLISLTPTAVVTPVSDSFWLPSFFIAGENGEKVESAPSTPPVTEQKNATPSSVQKPSQKAEKTPPAPIPASSNKAEPLPAPPEPPQPIEPQPAEVEDEVFVADAVPKVEQPIQKPVVAPVSTQKAKPDPPPLPPKEKVEEPQKKTPVEEITPTAQTAVQKPYSTAHAGMMPPKLSEKQPVEPQIKESKQVPEQPLPAVPLPIKPPDTVRIDRAEQQTAVLDTARLAKEKLEKERAANKARLELEKMELKRLSEAKALQERLAREEKNMSYVMERLAKLNAERERAAAKAKAERENLSYVIERLARLNAERERADSKAKAESEKAAKELAQKEEKLKGLPVPSIKGDIKLIVAGAAYDKLRMRFKEFEVNRRTRPFSPAELRRNENVTLISLATGEQKREFVIEKAREGVYTLELEYTGKPATFSIMLYEGTGRMVKKELPPPSAERKRQLVKILMPEGIFWDDEAVFSGSVEDSETVTRFNSDSGLVWKELNEEFERRILQESAQ